MKREQYLIALTILAAYALYTTNHYSLPIANVFAAFTVALPPLAGVALETIISFQSRLADQGELQTSKVFQAVNAAFLVYEAVLATLAGRHIAPVGGLLCPLQDKWTDLHTKKSNRIKTIQDAFQCCGFKTVKHMAYPFAPHKNGDAACMIRYERDTACLEPWRNMERKVAIMLLIVPIGIFVWKV